MKKRDPFPYRPSRFRVAPPEQMADLKRATEAALAALGDAEAAIAIVVARRVEGGHIAMHSAIAAKDDGCLERLVEAGPGSLASCIERNLRAKGMAS